VNSLQPVAGLTLSAAERPGAGWADFVAAHPKGTLYHTLPWVGLAAEVFRCQTFYVEARETGGQLAGVLPLVRQRMLGFGDRLTSLPYCNYGGPLARREGVVEALMARAAALAAELRVSTVELRDREPRNAGWSMGTDKVTFDLVLPADPEALGQALGSKLRSQIRRADREPIVVRIGSDELLGSFYQVFAENMRDVGTPVYPMRFFDAVGRRLAGQYQAVVIDLDGVPAAAGLILFYRDTAEIPWAACTRAGKARSVNMRLYWELLLASLKHGAKVFDFGRCTVDSGTYHFKKQWGAEPKPLYWHRWPPRGCDEKPGRLMAKREGGVKDLASRTWQRLPLWAANRLGPLISPGLPW
jgi:FemAB-related protein (PEP-CTERM system-associated)